MANPEHVAIVRRGDTEEIIEWWEKNKTPFDLNYADLSDVSISGLGFRSPFQGALVQDASLRNAFVSGVSLEGASFHRTVFDGCFLYDCVADRSSFEAADLAYAKLRYVSLKGVSFRGADLSHATLISCLLENALFAKSKFGGTILADVDLSDCRELELIEHHSPSTVGIDSVSKSKGALSRVFLQKCGIPEVLIDYLPSMHSANPLQFYKCFISASDVDDVFVQRLCGDLQSKNIRYWHWKRDPKGYRDLLVQIDEAIREYEKVLVICSRASLQSPPVIDEIARAVEREDRERRMGKAGEVLFPVMLDDYVLKDWNHPLRARVARKAIVVDFRGWQESETAYEKALAKLINDLQSA